MLKLKEKLKSESIIYLLSDITAKSAPFIALPFILAVMSIDEYATYSLFFQTSNILMIAVGLGLYSSINICFYKRWFDYKLYYALFVSLVMFLTVVLLVLSIIFFSERWVHAAILYGSLSCYVQIKLVEHQNKKEKWSFFLLQFIKSFIFIFGLILILKMTSHHHIVYDYIVAFSLAFILYLLISEYRVFSSVKNTPFKQIIIILTQGVKFAFPSFINSISGWIRNGIDRFFILSLYSLTQVGLMSFSFQVASVISVVGISINRAVNVSLLHIYTENDEESSRRKCNEKVRVVIVFLGAISTALYVFIHMINLETEYLLKYSDAISPLLPTLLASFVLQGGSGVYSSYLQYYGHNKILGVSSLIIGGAYIPVSFFSIKYCGYESVGFVFLFSWILQFSISYYYVNNYKDERIL
ncbi:hypothetical protein H4N55_12000 [Aeromonas veronii]|uniref:lipopolysaccharide biosynthesis protein n=1 Tax=Aeromonas veronii TaxID=654 RepID=UPI00188C6243|nr:hypothetical protein [Aeromonas veronii]MBF3237319.1 hypothetical protein [Aeromonas veronii]